MGNLAPGNVRLTVSIRDRIANKVLNHKFNKNNLEECREEYASLAQAVYNSVFNDKIKTQIESMPKGWLPKSSYVQARFGYDVSYLYFNGQVQGVPYDITKRMTGYQDVKHIEKSMPHVYMGGMFATFDANHELSERHAAIKTRVSKIVEEFKNSKAMLTTTLSKFHTTNRLIEAWPEVKPFVIEIVGTPASTSTALAVPISTLNARFGLPVPETT